MKNQYKGILLIILACLCTCVYCYGLVFLTRQDNTNMANEKSYIFDTPATGTIIGVTKSNITVSYFFNNQVFNCVMDIDGVLGNQIQIWHNSHDQCSEHKNYFYGASAVWESIVLGFLGMLFILFLLVLAQHQIRGVEHSWITWLGIQVD